MVARTALILGRAATVWNEIEAAKKLADFDVVIAINRMARDYKQPFQHWVSYHPDLFPLWTRERLEPLPSGLMYWSGVYKGQRLGDAKRLKLPIQYCKYSGGSSGMLAIKVAIDGLGLDRIVLAGIPMDDSPRYDDKTPWREADAYWLTWMSEKPWMAGRVRSMSGRTSKFLGLPDAAWLASGEEKSHAGEGVTAVA
jgi:hypothetical protein